MSYKGSCPEVKSKVSTVPCIRFLKSKTGIRLLSKPPREIRWLTFTTRVASIDLAYVYSFLTSDLRERGLDWPI